MSSLVDVLFATTPDGERVFSDAAVDHALPLVMLMVAFPLGKMPPRAQAAFVQTLAAAGASQEDVPGVLGDKIGAYYQKTPVEPRLMDAVMSWMRLELRDHGAYAQPNEAIAAKLGLDSPRFAQAGPKPEGAVTANPLARFALGQNVPKK